MSTKKKNQQKRNKAQKGMKVGRWVSIIVIIVIIGIGAIALINGKTNESAIELMDIHGAGFTKDGKLYIPAHDGLKVYSNGEWNQGEGEKNDYMGFSIVDDGFYSSGHPGEGSTKKNPLGIVKSEDMGKSLKMLNFYGEIDFHGLSAGYKSDAMYVFNPQENSKMAQTGLNYSLDDAKTWNKSTMNGVKGDISALAAHPTNEKIVAVSTNQGVFVSKDYGNTFEQISAEPATSVSFSAQGKLFAGGISSKMVTINIETKEAGSLNLPSLEKDDAVGYIAVNPKNKQQLAVTTFAKNIYISKDLGKNWTKIANQGKGINAEK